MNGHSGHSPLLVSLAEVVEVRASTLSTQELLALAAVSSSVLPSCSGGRAFGPAQVFLSADGVLRIEAVPRDVVEEEFHPPEWREGGTGEDSAAAAVFCMGAVLRWCGGATTTDTSLFSLVNVLTVAMVATRPTASRMGQMAKNQLKGADANELLEAMYTEIMGDGSDMMDEDDVSFDSDDVPVLKGPPTKQAQEYYSEEDENIEDSDDDDEEEEASKDSNMNERRPPVIIEPVATTRLYEKRRDDPKRDINIPSTSHFVPPPPKEREAPAVTRSSFDDDDIIQASVDDDFLLTTSRPFNEELKEELRKQEEEESQRRRRPIAVPPPVPVIVEAPREDSPVVSARNRGLSDPFEDAADTDEAPPVQVKPPPPTITRSPFDDSEEEEEEERRHVDAVVLHSAAASTAVDSEDEEMRREPRKTPVMGTATLKKEPRAEEEETTVEEAFREAKEQRKASIVAVAATLPRVSSFSRRNSLASGRVSGRNLTRKPRKTRAEPEFVEREQMAAIRLKAPTTRKKSLLHRVEETSVQVRLLHGQIIEVACRSDALTSDVFSLVVTHTKLTEHVFFGLCTMRDGEQYFLDDDQRLEKMAPAGWKSAIRGSPSVQYVLHLRFRFYPTYVEFIKTPSTLHALFLQLRRDILDCRLEARRDVAFDLAALALQAEFGDRPAAAIVDYFSTGHYLPPALVRSEDPARGRTLLSELHSHYSGTRTREAELKYIEICQRLPEYGCHNYRVFRSKAAALSSPSPLDAASGSALWIGIMPKGIVVSENQMGQRVPVADHPWQRTHTLQFDKKRFVIVDLATDADGERKQSVFFTDHHTKSAYFVRFAASQHRFMIKMRQWKNTLKNEKRVASMPDVAVEGRATASPLDNAESMFEKVPSHPGTLQRSEERERREERGGRATAHVMDTSIASIDRTHDTSANESAINQSLLARLDEAEVPEDGENLHLSIVKDPAAGLGLTLVDGHLNGVPGVYVKSVADGGAGQSSGLNVGDRLLTVNGESLEGKDRHRAVQLVKESSSLVSITVSRIHGIVTQHKNEGAGRGISAVDLKQGSLAALLPPRDTGRSMGGSRTPPAPRKAPAKRTRAVSDFGALGDALPELNSEEIIADMKSMAGRDGDSEEEESGEYRLPQTTSLYGDEKEEGRGEEGRANGETRRRSEQYGTFPRRRSNMELEEAAIEEVREEESDEDDDLIHVSLDRNDNGSLGVQVASAEGRVRIQAITAKPALGHPLLSDGDWLVAVNGETTEGKAHKDVVAMLKGGGDTVRLTLKRANRDDRFKIILDKSTGRALGNDRCGGDSPSCSLSCGWEEKGGAGEDGVFAGLSLAKRVGCEGVFVRMIGAGSVAEADGRLRVGDRIMKVDGEKVGDSSPTRIVEELKSAKGKVELVVSRPVGGGTLGRPPSASSMGQRY